eukprot:scaffold1469_cov119-Cylindrotheca_fusiformis.AAC.18
MAMTYYLRCLSRALDDFPYDTSAFIRLGQSDDVVALVAVIGGIVSPVEFLRSLPDQNTHDNEQMNHSHSPKPDGMKGDLFTR